MTKSNDIFEATQKSSEEDRRSSQNRTLDSSRREACLPRVSEIPLSAPLPNLFSQLRTVYLADLPKNDKILLAYLCHRVDGRSGSTWICVRTMSIECGLCLRTVKSSLKSLKMSGWIDRIPRPNKSSITQLSSSKFQEHETKKVGVNITRQSASGDESFENSTASIEGQPKHQPSANLAPGPGNLRTQSTKYPRTNKGEESSFVTSVDKKTLLVKADSSRQNRSDLFQSLRDEFSSTFTEEQLRWAIEQIKRRAKTPPRSRSYWQKSLVRFEKDFQSEVDMFLQAEAKQLLAQGSPIGDVVEKLKWRAAENHLPYDSLRVQYAIDAAEFSQRREAEVQSELRVGGRR